MPETVKVKPDKMQFNELMIKIRNGEIRIPDFQREFVWDQSQIVSLLDSIYRHYPVGSILLWETDDEIQSYRRIGEVELRTDRARSVQYVLDGQQRLTSLFASLEQAEITHRVNGKKVTRPLLVYFDLDDERFVTDPFSREDDGKGHRYSVLRTVDGAGDLPGCMVNLLVHVRAGEPDHEELLRLIEKDLGTSARRAKHLATRLAAMGLYTWAKGNYRIAEAGLEVIEKKTMQPVLVGLVQVIKYVEEMLPELLERPEIDETEIVESLSVRHGMDVSHLKVRRRLEWLARLGMGILAGTRFSPSDTGREAIAAVLSGMDARKRNLEERERRKKQRYFSVRQITDLNVLVDAARELDDRRLNALKRVATRFTEYPFSVIEVRDQPVGTACEIFERINTSGKVLNVVDLMVAKSWSPTFNLREELSAFREELKKQGYDDVPDITMLQCISAILNKSVMRKDILGIERGLIESNWDAAVESIRKAIDFLKSNVKITRAKILPYNALIVPLAYFYHVSAKEAWNVASREALVRWFWKASFSTRYDAAADTKLGDDIEQMEKLAADGVAEFDYVSPILTASRIMDQRLNLGSAFCKAILCVFNFSEPREFKDGSPVLLTSFSKFNSAEFHHIFPRAYLRDHDAENFERRDCVPNIAMARASANKEYSGERPSVYLPACSNPDLGQALKTHFIEDVEKSGLLEDDFEGFMEYRAERILAEIRKLTGDMSEVEADLLVDEFSAIEKFEHRMRNLLHDNMSRATPSYWGITATPEFREKIEERIQEWLRLNPARSRRSVREIDFLQILEYLKVAKCHWVRLKEVLKSRTDLEMHLKNINNLRKEIMHLRESNQATRQLALGSLSWFDEVFKAEGV